MRRGATRVFQEDCKTLPLPLAFLPVRVSLPANDPPRHVHASHKARTRHGFYINIRLIFEVDRSVAYNRGEVHSNRFLVVARHCFELR